MARKNHVLVIGAGLSGLSAALRLVETDNWVTLISKGIGGLPLSPGTLDVLGYLGEDPVHEPLAAVSQLPPWHPYQRIGAENITAALTWLVSYLPQLYAPRQAGQALENSWLPTAVGTARPSGVAPLSAQNALLRDGMKLLVVGIRQFKDFPATLIADNLARSNRVQVSARAIEISLDARGLADVKGTDYARALDSDSQLMKQFAEQINAAAEPGETVLVPALVGLNPQTFPAFAAQVTNPVAEVPTPPPCVPGERLNNALTDLLVAARVDMRNNARVTGVTSDGGRIATVTVARAGGNDNIKVDAVVDAAGGFASGNLSRDSYLAMHEAIFDLPLFTPPVPEKPGIHAIDTRQKTLVEQILSSGILVNDNMQALRPATEGGDFDTVAFENLYVIGEALAGTNPASEISGEGLALGSMWSACEAINAVNAGKPGNAVNAGKGEVK